jgi:hypothetical protein
VEADIWQYYGTHKPGQVQVLAADLFNGSAASLNQFRTTTGATYPLMLNGAAGAGAENLLVTYGDRDNYAVINKQGIVRYHAYDRWPYGNRYHLDELRGCIDTLVTTTADVDPGPVPGSFALRVSPNPFRSSTIIELVNPGEPAADARVEIFDLAGRQVLDLWRGVAPQGLTRVPWRTRGGGQELAPGVYTVRAQVGSVRLVRRVVLIPS